MTTDEQSSNDTKTYPKPAYAWYVVVLMMFFYVLSFMDRQIIAVLRERLPGYAVPRLVREVPGSPSKVVVA